MINHWHTFDFPEYSCVGEDNSPAKLNSIELPQDLKNKTLLDIGAWDGYFSFVAEKRGAKVTAIDSWVWQKDLLWDARLNKFRPHSKKLGFETAKKALNSNVKDIEMEVDEITYDKVGQFDIVLCLGILYHMKDPYKIIRNLYSVTKELLIIETHHDGNYLSVPAMIFYPDKELNNDPDNWWGPNLLCLYQMLRVAGFKEIKLIGASQNRAVIHALK